MEVEISIDEFENWLRDRGYAKMFGEENLRMYLGNGLSSLFFSNSTLLMSCLFTKLGIPSERITDKVRSEISKRVKKIYVDEKVLKIKLDL